MVLEKNGSVFIKLGQHLAAMGYLLPLEWTTTFIPLQDQCPVSSIESIRKVLHGFVFNGTALNIGIDDLGRHRTLVGGFVRDV